MRRSVAALIVPGLFMILGMAVSAAPSKAPEAEWHAPRQHEGFDSTLRPVHSSYRRTLYKDGHLQVRALLAPCGEENWCAVPAQCFDGIYRVACRCDSRSLDVWEDKKTSEEAQSLVTSLAHSEPERQEILIGTAAEATRRLFAHCPLKRFDEVSILLDGRFAGTARIEEPVPQLSPVEGEQPVVGLWFRVSLSPHPRKAAELQTALDEGALPRLRLDNLSTGVERHLVELSEPELIALETEILDATTAYDPSPTLQDPALEDQRRLCQALPVKENINSKAWTVFAKIAHGTDCVAPVNGLFAVLRPGERGLKTVMTLPAGDMEGFALYRLTEVVDLKGDGKPDVLVGPVLPQQPIQEGFGAFINTAPGKWKFEQWKSGEDR